jgi:hypothetical protein
MQLMRPGLWLFRAAAAISLTACSAPKGKPAAPTPAPVVAAPVLPPMPVTPPTVDRAELMAAVSVAAEAFALGNPYPKVVEDLAGRRFSVKLPFGCSGPDGGGPLNYSYASAKMTLKVAAQPEHWTVKDAAWTMLASDKTEAIEGFWISRPWISADACPVLRTPPAQPTPLAAAGSKPTEIASSISLDDSQTVGLARVFEKDGSRLLQRGARPYQVIRKSEGQVAGGFRLVLEGRIIAPGDLSPISCRSGGLDQRPVCLVRIEFDRVAIESVSGDLLGEWNS